MTAAETARHARGAQLAFAVQVAGVVVSYALQIVLARALGPAGFGSYSFVLAWTGPLASTQARIGPARCLPAANRAALAGVIQ